MKLYMMQKRIPNKSREILGRQLSFLLLFQQTLMILGKASSPSHSDRMERDGALKRSENRAAMVFGQARNAFLIPRDDLMQNRRSSMY